MKYKNQTKTYSRDNIVPIVMEMEPELGPVLFFPEAHPVDVKNPEILSIHWILAIQSIQSKTPLVALDRFARIKQIHWIFRKKNEKKRTVSGCRKSTGWSIQSIQRKKERALNL